MSAKPQGDPPANRDRTILRLPPPRLDGKLSLEQAIARRRSLRHYSRRELTLEQIGQLLWAAQGLTGSGLRQRAAPSAGACHPLELYVCRQDGVWHYNAEYHRLHQHLPYDVRESLVPAAFQQTFIAAAPCVIAVSVVWQRTIERYTDRGRVRYVPMDVGHATQNLLLEAVALGLGAVPVGAFDDRQVKNVLSLPPDEDAFYLIPIGYPA